MSKKSRHLKPDDAGGLLDGAGHVVTSYVPDFEDCVLPYCTWYQDDFLGAVRGMKAAEIGIYTMLLNEMYESGRALDMPLDRLARRCGTTKKTLQASIEFFIDEGKIIQLDSGLWNGRVQKIFVHRRKNSTANSEAGKKSAEKRNKNNERPERALSGRSTGDEPIPETQSKSNNSEDKSSSLLPTRETRNEDGYLDFLKAHPRPRETARGEEAWLQAITSGQTAEELIASARRYAEVSKTFDGDKIQFSDNWLSQRSWERYPVQKTQTATEDEKLKFWADKINEGGKVWGLQEPMVRACVEAGLVTPDRANAVLAAA